jgi:hypothetical protein
MGNRPADFAESRALVNKIAEFPAAITVTT